MNSSTPAKTARRAPRGKRNPEKLLIAVSILFSTSGNAAPLETLTQLPVTFVLNDLLNTENNRYSFDAVVNGVRQRITSNNIDKNLSALALPVGADMAQSFFQFNILDGVIPTRQYSVFVTSTRTRCTIFHPVWNSAVFNIELVPGREMEIYSMVIEPRQRKEPQRSEVRKICTSDLGRLAFNLGAPSTDAFEVKVQNFLQGGANNSELNFSIPMFQNYTVGAQ